MPSKEVYDLKARRAWPPVEVVEREETAREVAMYAAVLTIGAVIVGVAGSHTAFVELLGYVAGVSATHAVALKLLFDERGA